MRIDKSLYKRPSACRLASLAWLLLLVLLTSCADNNRVKDSIPSIMVSIPPQQYFVQRIAGELVRVSVLVPPGMGPETYDPSPGDLERVAKASVYFISGYLDFEGQLVRKLQEQHQNTRFIDLSAEVELLGASCKHEGDQHAHAHGGVDPHYWMSPAEVEKAALKIHAVLSEILPEQKNRLDEGLAAFLQDVSNLDSRLKEKFKDLKTRKFILFHPSLSYLARDYGLEQLPLEQEGKLPSPRQIVNLINVAKTEGISTVFLQSQFDRNNMESLAREIDAKLVLIDPLAADWLGNFVIMSDQLREAMNGR